VSNRGFSLIDVLVAISLFALVAGLSLLALYKVEGTRRAYEKEAAIRQLLLWYATEQGISSSFSWRTVARELNPRLFSPSDPIAPLVSKIHRYYSNSSSSYPNRVYAVLDSAPTGVTYSVRSTSSGGYLLETRNITIRLQLQGLGVSDFVFTLGNDLFSYLGRIPSKSFVAIP
jgi:type II secretory pathway pseudopilin PulG